ncbi:hypothetical protein, partial [Phaeodactylibacter xiamenensis]
ANGNILDGHGQFIYEIDFATTAQPVVGFTGDFAPGNWSILQQNNGSVSFAANGASVDFDGPDGIGCFGTGAEASIAIAMPNDGNVTFDYDYTSLDIFGSGWDAFIALVDANGNVTVLVNTINSVNAAGTVNVDVAAGDVLAIGVASVDCTLGPGVATVDNFVFSPLTPDAAGFEPCWGYVTGEDKTAPVIECPDDTDVATVSVPVQ